VTYYKDAKMLAKLSEDLGEPMVGIGLSELPEGERMAKRGW
jgi:pyridoxal 5'-phosphate synthase pdxS subunit